MKPETHEYLRAHRAPGHVPGEFVDSLREAWERFIRKSDKENGQ